MSQLPTALKKSRCILHIDLDCFYCQVEQARLGIPFDVPAAVQQWQGLIAVNYAARNAGIARHCTVAEAKKLCPEIKLLHVATYGPNDKEPHYYTNPNRNTHKVSLDPYRNASREIFKIFHSHCDTIQKIGSDEGFMDVTKVVNQRLMDRYIAGNPELLEKLDNEECGVHINWEKLGVVIESKEEISRRLNPKEETDSLDITSHWNSTTWRDLQLAIGAELAAEIRQEVFDKLNYSCSAGIAHYKVVAKLCSSKNKPSKQTVLREAARLDFMREVPFKKIRNLGGKLGNEVGEDLEILNASEIWKYSVEDLQDKFGASTGLYLYDICRGIDNEEVSPSKAPKSLMAAKTFTKPITRAEDMQPWFTILSVELHTRIMRHFDEYGTWPKSISIKYCSRSFKFWKSKTIGPIHKDEMETHEILSKKFQNFYNALEDSYPCIGIDLAASGLVHDESSKSHTISSFFTKSANSAHDANGMASIIEPTKDPVVENECKVKRNTLFFTKSTTPNSASPFSAELGNDVATPTEDNDEKVDEWTCDKCNRLIPLSEVDEHTDYHFALEISKQFGVPSSTTSTTNDSSQSKKRKPATKRVGVKDDKKLKLSSFFKPRST